MISAMIIQGLLKKYSSSVKYKVWNLSLIAILVIPLLSDLGQPLEVDLYEYDSFVTEQVKTETIVDTETNSIQAIKKGTAAVAEKSPISFVEISAIAWLLGILLLAALLIRETIWLRTLLLTGSKATVSLHSILLECQRKINLNRRIKILYNKRVNTPLTFGYLRPIVVLPEIAKDWEEEKIKIVLLHELIHIKRNDYLTNLIASLGVIICWYNPLVWFALKQQKAECEKACDEQVLANDIKPTQYASELLKLAEGNHVGTLKLNSMVSILGATSIKERIKLIIESPKRKKAVSLSLVIALSFLVLFEAYSLSSIQFYTVKNLRSTTFTSPRKDSNSLELINSEKVQIRREAAKALISDYNPRIMIPIFNQLRTEEDPEVTTSLIAAITKFENSREFYLVARQINSEDLKVKLQVLDYMEAISCFPSYLVIEACINDQDPAISAAALKHFQRFDEAKLKRSIRNFAINFKYNNNLTTSIGNKMSWINGYQSIDELSEILKSEDASKKRILGERLLAISNSGDFTKLKEVINQTK